LLVVVVVDTRVVALAELAVIAHLLLANFLDKTRLQKHCCLFPLRQTMPL
jgi:hypothetical protein